MSLRRTLVEAIGRPKTATMGPDGVEPLSLEIVKGEVYQFDADISTHPVEEGAPVDDHIDNQAPRLTLDVMISSSPAVFLAFRQGRTDPAQVAYSVIRQWREERRRLTVALSFEVFESMAIASWSPLRELPAKKALVFSLNLQQIRTVNSEGTILSAAALQAAEALRQEQEGGTQQGTDLNCDGLVNSILDAVVSGGGDKSRAASVVDNIGGLRACWNQKRGGA